MPLTYTLQTPSVVKPDIGQGTLSINASALPLVVAADTSTQVIGVVISETGDTYQLSSYTQLTVGGVKQRQFSGSVPLPGVTGTYTIKLTAQDSASSPTQASPVASFSVIVADMTNLVVAYPPASIQVMQLYDRVRIRWADVTTPGFLGVRIQTSTDSSGVSVPYTQFGDLVANNSTYKETVVLDSTTVTTQGSLSSSTSTDRTTTTKDTLRLATYSSVDITQTAVGADQFYALVSCMVQDPDTMKVYESVASGPFTCSFVSLNQVAPSDFPPSTQPEQIAATIISQVAQDYGSLDQSARSETRDLQVDPYALELSNGTIRSWFTRVSASLSALIAIDDADGDGVSDSASSSQTKQVIARAFRVTDTQVQLLIDNQFDVQAESAGLTRKGAQASIVPVTFYVLTAPKRRISVTLGSIVATIPDTDTASVSFTALASGLLDPTNLSAYWIPELSGWGFTIDCQCTTSGSSGSVGAGTIRSVVSGASAPMLCTNLTTATLPGQDQQTNASLATMVRNRKFTGIDSGTAGGYFNSAMACYGVTDSKVVQCGDLEMLRDWDPVRAKHTFGCVDVYARGANYSQVTQDTPYTLSTDGTQGTLETYTKLSFSGLAGNRIKFTVPAGLLYDVAAITEVWLNRTGGVYLGTQTALWDPQAGALYLNPNDLSYTYNTDGTVSTGASNSAWLTGMSGVSVLGLLRYWSPLEVTPSKEPVQQVISVVGNGGTGALPASGIILDKTASDPLLTGSSTQASDTIRYPNGLTTMNTQFTWSTDGLLTLDLGEGVHVPTVQVDTVTGVPSPGNILSVRSQDASILYDMGTDYQLVVLGPYNRFGLKRSTSSTIPLDKPVLISYQRYQITENLTLRTDSITLSGSTAVSLNYPGFVHGVRLPVTHGLSDLASDTDLIAAQVGYLKRYIKVFVTGDDGANTVYLEGSDFTLTIDATLGPRISKFVSGTTSPSRIADDTVLTVVYYTAEVFTTAYSYPEFLTQLGTAIKSTKHGGADTLPKAMTANKVDMSFTVTLANSPTSTPAIEDPLVRTAVSLAVSMASTQLSQSDVVRLVRALPGVTRMNLPLTRFTKADGSYVIGEVIPTGTSWVSPSGLNLPTSLFPVSDHSWVTADPVLSCSTCPSGATQYAFAGLLYEGQSYRRCMTLAEFSEATDLAFYIIGVNDAINTTTPVASQHAGKVLLHTPSTTASPTLLSYRVTYQVFGEASAQDLSLSSLEYLIPGQISIAYEIEGQ